MPPAVQARRRGQTCREIGVLVSSAASLHGTDGRRAGKCLENGAALSRVKMHREIDLAPFANLSSVLTDYARKFVSMQYTPCFLELASSQRYVSYGAFLEHFHPSHRALGATCFIALHPCRCSWLRAPLAPCGLVARRPCGGR